MDSINEQHHTEALALNLVVGLMIAHETRFGASPYEIMNVERVFSAIKMLSEKDSLEIAPYVSGWTDDRLDRIGQLPSGWVDRFKKAVISTTHWQLAKEFTEGVLALMDINPLDRVYESLMRRMLVEIRALLSIEDEERFDYLSPLFGLPGVVRIATLNYDLGVEAAAGRHRVRIDRGIEQWSGGFEWNWRNRSRVRLLKLHGSLDWSITEPARTPGDAHFANRSPIVTLGGEAWDVHGWGGPQPGVVFGNREKLRTDGPFLAMLFEFSKWLRSTDHLIVVGYSFGDDHINTLIRDWLGNGTAGRHMSIIDPGFPVSMSDGGKHAPFATWLRQGIAVRQVSEDGRPVGMVLDDPLFTISTKGAAVALPAVCSWGLDLK